MLQAPNHISPASAAGAAPVIDAIRQASERTGVDFSYLLEEARTESSLDPAARAATGSASGLFQFIEITWLEIIHRHGDKHGLDEQAAAISHDDRGRPVVADPEQRAAILKLREDPAISALMAAELALDNGNVLERRLGREVTNTELYMAHFLGAGGAAKFIEQLEHNPGLEADSLLPRAARNNQAVFYQGGQALSLHQVFERFETRFGPRAMPPPPPVNPLPGLRPMPLPPASLVAEAAEPAADRPANAAPLAMPTGPVLPASPLQQVLGNAPSTYSNRVWQSAPVSEATPTVPATSVDTRQALLRQMTQHAIDMLSEARLQGRDRGNEWIV